MNLNEKPVGAAASITALLIVLINAAVGMLTALNIVQWDTTQQAAINAFVVALVNVGAVVGPYLWARKQTTPLAAPRDETGAELVRKVDGMPTLTQTRNALKK